MAHNIFGERYTGREPAWHGLGQVFTDKPTAVEAVTRVGLDYRVEKRPVYVDTDAGLKLAKDLAIVRYPTDDDPQFQVFGYVSKQYNLLDNVQIAQAMDSLTEIYPIETAAALGRGETMFLSLDVGEWAIDHDVLKTYLLFTDNKSGKKAARFLLTHVRAVCDNTLSLALREAVISVPIQHDAGAEQQLEWRVAMLKRVSEAQASTQALFGKLIQSHITLDDARHIFEKAYPVGLPPKRMVAVDDLPIEERSEFEEQGITLVDSANWLRVVTARMEARREAAMECYLADQWTETTIETPWAAFNAVVEVEDYRGRPTEASLTSMLFGERAKTKAKAFEYAMAVARG